MLFAFLPLLALALLAAVGVRNRQGRSAPALTVGPGEAAGAAATGSFLIRPEGDEQADGSAIDTLPREETRPAQWLLPVPDGQAPAPAIPQHTSETGTGTALATRQTAAPSWVRRHGSQVALLLTALGGAARVLVRTRHRGRRRGRHRVG